jgi:hypothetical protein
MFFPTQLPLCAPRPGPTQGEEPSTPLDLPTAIAAYFAADKVDGGAVARCFAEQAVVRDEGHIYNCRAAIRQWRADTSAKYNCTSEPVIVEHEDGKTVVTCHVVGDFPGSPVDLRYFFVLEGDKIASLEIIPCASISD